MYLRAVGLRKVSNIGYAHYLLSLAFKTKQVRSRAAKRRSHLTVFKLCCLAASMVPIMGKGAKKTTPNAEVALLMILKVVVNEIYLFVNRCSLLAEHHLNLKGNISFTIILAVPANFY